MERAEELDRSPRHQQLLQTWRGGRGLDDAIRRTVARNLRRVSNSWGWLADPLGTEGKPGEQAAGWVWRSPELSHAHQARMPGRTLERSGYVYPDGSWYYGQRLHGRLGRPGHSPLRSVSTLSRELIGGWVYSLTTPMWLAWDLACEFNLEDASSLAGHCTHAKSRGVRNSLYSVQATCMRPNLRSGSYPTSPVDASNLNTYMTACLDIAAKSPSGYSLQAADWPLGKDERLLIHNPWGRPECFAFDEKVNFSGRKELQSSRQLR